MEQHPVPRNISSFEFHLIGDMTVRQFAYLAAGALIAFMIYKLFPLPPLLKFALIGFSAFAGFAFAFLPIQERPLDKWLLAFIKSINSPTQYIWQKDIQLIDILAHEYTSSTKKLSTTHLEAHRDAQEKLKKYLATLPQTHAQTLNVREKKYVDQTLSLFNTTDSHINFKPQSATTAVTTPSQNTTAQNIKLTAINASFTPLSVPKQTSPSVAISHPQKQQLPVSNQKLSTPILTPQLNPQIAKSEEEKTPQTTDNHIDSQLAKITAEKEALEKELANLKKSLEQLNQPQVVKPVVEQSPKPTIKSIPAQNAASEAGMPNLPHVVNMVMGVVKDMQKRLLPNIMLTIKDTKGFPVRALKTNSLGQFSTATPLPNGTFFMEAEDPLKRYTFDIAEINLTGKVFLPIEILAKSEKERSREKLAKELFGNV